MEYCLNCTFTPRYPWADTDVSCPQKSPFCNVATWKVFSVQCSLCRMVSAVAQDLQQQWKWKIIEVQVWLTLQEIPFMDIAIACRLHAANNGKSNNCDVAIYSVSQAEDAECIWKIRPHERIPDSLHCRLEQAKSWLSTCVQIHECGTSISNMPTRLVDIDNGPRLIDGSKIQPTPYVAFSYCWGDPSRLLKTERETLRKHQQKIPYESLLQNFRDLFEVMRALGYSYVWIDCLCIVQDDNADWQKEAALMQSVYGNADVVITASSAKNCNIGFLGPRLPHEESIIPMDTPVPTITYRIIPNHQGWFPIYGGHLDTRAWCFQERLLAKRFLSFGEYEMTWECGEGYNCECGYKPRIMRKTNAGYIPDTFTKSYNMKTLLAPIEHMVDPIGKLYWAWRYSVIQLYTSRELSFGKDKLVALSAVAKRFQECLQDEYLAGLWRKTLIADLCWACESQTSLEDMKDTKFPSWSWASVKGAIWNRMFERSILDMKPVYQAEVIDAWTTPENEGNVFGSVKEAQITLKGIVIQGVLERIDGRYSILGTSGSIQFESVLIDTHISKISITLSDGVRMKTTARTMETLPRQVTEIEYPVWLLGLYQLSLDSEGSFLILGRSSSSPEKYERIGYATTRAVKTFESLDLSTITII